MKQEASEEMNAVNVLDGIVFHGEDQFKKALKRVREAINQARKDEREECEKISKQMCNYYLDM